MWRVAALTAAGMLLAACSSSGGTTTRPPLPSLSPVSSVRHVVYQLGGDAPGADITITTTAGQSQQRGVTVPMRSKQGSAGLSFDADPGQFLYISAQNTGDGILSCEITVDGTVVSSNESSGQYAIASCQGTA